MVPAPAGRPRISWRGPCGISVQQEASWPTQPGRKRSTSTSRPNRRRYPSKLQETNRVPPIRRRKRAKQFHQIARRLRGGSHCSALEELTCPSSVGRFSGRLVALWVFACSHDRPPHRGAVDVAFSHDQIRLIVASITVKATVVQPRCCLNLATSVPAS